ncbi:MAG: acyltransferase family protein [Methylovirgula sp.]
MIELGKDYERVSFLPHLDGLRALAVILVLISHFPYIAGSHLSKDVWQIVQIGRTGYIGVDLFFVLSGFLITRLLLRERVETGSISLTAFYTRRMLRIFPIYYLCVFVTALAFPPDHGATLSLAAYVFNYYHPLHPAPYPMEHAWSLAVEEQFYLLWPTILVIIPLAWGRRVTGILIPAVALAAAITLSAILKPDLAAAFIYSGLPTRMLSLSLGAYIAFREADHAPLQSYAYSGLVTAGLLALGLDGLGRALGLIPSGGWYWCVALAGFALIGYGALAYLAFQPAVWVKRLLSWPPLAYIGRISYGIYLYHLIILFAFRINPARADGVGAPVWKIAAALALTLVVSALSHAFIERPFLELKARFARRPRAAKPSALPVPK